MIKFTALQKKGLFSQPTLFQVLEKKGKYDGSSQQKKQLDEALITMIAQDMQPLSIVDDKGFRNFCNAMDRRYQVPRRVQLCDVLLPEIFDKVQGQMKKKLGLANSVSLTTDLWTSTNNSGFMTLTCHWWNEGEEKLDSAILDCCRIHGRHTAGLIQGQAEIVLKEFGIHDKVLTFVTDNGSNVVKAVQDMGIRRFSCYAHILNLVVTDAFQAVPELRDAKEKVSKIVKLTRKSTVAKEKLDQIQKTLGKKPKKLIQYCPTRWNSLYEMFQRFAKLKDSITLLLAHTVMDEDVGPISSGVWEVIEDAIELLAPCFEATVELSGEKISTGSKAIPMTKMLMSYYAAAEREANEGSLKKNLAHHILQNLNKRFDIFEDIRILALATLLDPRFKNRCFRLAEKKKNAIANLNKELKECYEKETPEEVQVCLVNA